jgi:hypothetical protein
VGFAIGALGIVGIGVGTGFGISALSQKDEYDSRWSGGLCRSPDNCAAATEAKRSLDRTTLVSTIGFGVGAVGLITGLYLVLSTPSAKPPPAAVRVSPVLGETHGLAIAGEF